MVSLSVGGFDVPEFDAAPSEEQALTVFESLAGRMKFNQMLGKVLVKEIGLGIVDDLVHAIPARADPCGDYFNIGMASKALQVRHSYAT